MFPTPEQIRIAAYDRWLRRGRAHGHDCEDWAAAEQDLLFALNYQVIAHYRLDESEPRSVGRRQPRVCRFCEQAAPRARFTDPIRPIPEELGNQSLQALDECDDCHAQFAEGALDSFLRFHETLRDRVTAGPIGLAAYKGLTKMALSLLPEAELEYVPDTLEWVSNPDHEVDQATFAGLGCHLHRGRPEDGPFAAVARRRDDQAPVPYLLLFLGTAAGVFEAPVPLCVRDEDLEPGAILVPRVASPLGPPFSPTDPWCAFLPLATTQPRRPAAARFSG